MNSKKWLRKALSTCLAAATIATSSMITLANAERVTGELLFSSTNSNATSSVKVNGETAQNGRSIFSSSNVVTPADAGAIINLGKLGSIELAPNSSLTLSFDDKGISGNLLAGQVTVLDSSSIVNIGMVDGSTASLNAGESTTASSVQDDDATDGGNTGAMIALVAILGGAAAAIIIAATSDNNRTALGGNSTVVSPTR